MKRLIAALTALMTVTAGFGGYFPKKTADAAAKFTHTEWTGKNGAEAVFAVNREGASVNAIPYQSTEAAVNAVWDYNAREDSDYLQMLTGPGQDWQLNVVQNAEKAQKYLNGGFMNGNYYADPADGWKNVELPKSWTMQGFDFPIYANVVMPWQSKYNEWVQCPSAPNNYNPVGLYRKTFTADSSVKASGRRVYIEFDGVESAYYVYLNGQEIGYSEDTFSPHRFDITDYLKDGENILAVEVHKFCDGTWFEGQDMIYDGGIFRDVFLVSTPDVRINDYTVRTDLDNDFKNAELQLSIDIANITSSGRSGWTVEAAAYDESGKNIISGSVGYVPELGQWQTKTMEMNIPVTAPKLWSAEDPNLYALVLTLKDDKGNAVETVSTQLGFREINFTSTQVDANYKVTTKEWQPITINGKRLLLKGVNRHDTDPFNGKAVPQNVMEEDIRLMQQNNINAVRTSHYSNDSYLYWLCNKYGMYVMAETNMECHALMNNDNNDKKALFKPLGMDRTETAYKRLKNNPSIVAWSIGNEMSYTDDPSAANGLFRDMIWYFKNNDPTRPVHSEGQGSSMGVDMGSNMYPASQWLGMSAGNGKIPYVMCEYDHAMGNSLGALKEYMDVVRSADNMLGGFIWDWADQSRAVDLSKVDSKWDYYSESYAHKNLYADESKGCFYAYGGDWGDNPNDNSFCQNGIVSPDRDPQPEIAEVKYQYQDFWFSADSAKLAANKVTVYNENNFTDLSEYDVKWELLRNGISFQSGTLKDAFCKPHGSVDLSIPFQLPKSYLAGDEFYLNISVYTKKATDMVPAGYEISYQQFKIDSTGQTVSNEKAPAVGMTEGDEEYIFYGADFNFAINKNTGLLYKYTYKGDILMTDGPSFNFWRGYVENDTNSAKQNLFDTGWEKALSGVKVDSVKVSDGEGGSKVVSVALTLPSAGNTKAYQTYTISGDGSIKVDMSVDATSSGMGGFLRVGSMMTLPEGSEDVTWYGNGPVETFNDRKTNARQGIWKNSVSGMFYPYMKADDTGNLTDIKWITVRDKTKNSALLIAAEGTVEGSALHFKPSDFAADHPYEMTPRKETYLSIDYGSMGTGSATCGQATLEKYRLPSNKVYSWSYTIMPIGADDNDAAIANKTARLRSDGLSVQDKSHNSLVIPVGPNAKLKDTASGKAMSGEMKIPFSGVIDQYVEGKNSFTVEAVIVPTGEPEFNMFAGKGDGAFALRTRKGYLDFFIYADGDWRSLYCAMSTDTASGWIGNKHQVAGIYNAENSTIAVYCDGKLLGEQKVTANSGVAHSGYDLTIGACPETGRSSQADFYELRLYSKALTASELSSQMTASPAYSPDNKNVQLWIDFDNLADGGIIGDVNADGKVNVADLVMLSKYVLGDGDVTDWIAGDVCTDDRLDAYDVAALRKILTK